MMSADDEYITFVVPEGCVKQRADKVLANYFTDFSRGSIQQAFKDGHVKLNETAIEQKHKVSEGNALSWIFPKSKEIKLVPVAIPLEILYEDNHIVAVNKPSGMVVHPGHATGDNTLVHALLHHTQGKLSPLSGKARPGVVHRLDKETTGVILFAKSNKAYLGLIKMFSDRAIRKEYLALVAGSPELDSGSIKEPIARHPRIRVKMAVTPKGREAHTDWAVEERFTNQAARLRLWLHTGRTHQIRVHLSALGYPILGDRTYGYRHKEGLPKSSRVLLHAQRIAFNHPITDAFIELEAPIPQDFEDQMALLRK